MPVRLNSLVGEFDMLDGTMEAYLDRRTGEVHWYSEFAGIGELPADVDDEEKYIPLPDPRELGLGKPLVLEFTRDVLPDDFDEVRQIFSHKGAYRRFKGFLAQRKATDREDNAIEVADDVGGTQEQREP